MINLEDKVFEGIISWFKDKNQRAIVALSGGVDSAVVALAAKKALDKKAIAVTADYNTLSADELKSARKITKEINIEHKIIRYNELENTEFVKNDSLRCYHCRSELASYLLHEAKKIDVELVVDGTNIDDLKDYRPGIKALRENGIKSPLVELGIGKNNVRSIVSVRQVRVRDHQDLARIEVAKEEIKEMFDTKKLSEIDSKLRNLGFKHIALDLSGYKSRENINTSSSNNTI
jgi:uncharacterized protein